MPIIYYLDGNSLENNGVANPSFRFYGIIKDPETHKYMMVLEYFKGGSLRNYLNNNFNNIDWDDKLYYLSDLADNFSKIHKLDIVHRDFHPGNILKSNDYIYIYQILD